MFYFFKNKAKLKSFQKKRHKNEQLALFSIKVKHVHKKLEINKQNFRKRKII